ncbi:hypothetical protein [Bacillus sp. FJAT-27245]|uniref:hypothetical protein n=1 Tax=Bacillus sp. FJAT-27245 TaxID=1684144 RepID=UPI0006A7B8EE|nr:hypothetical protein [Bacillus sp. FJAT-27245]
MLTYNVLPEHIKKVAEQFNNRKEKLDVLPSKFHYGNVVYYPITYLPSLETLFITEDGEVPLFEEVKRPMLIVSVYENSGNTILTIGRRWVSSKTIKNYSALIKSLESISIKIKNKAPRDEMENLERFLAACKRILNDQRIIEDCFHKGLDLINQANETEFVSEEEQKLVRQYVVEMTRAAVRQNQEQLDCEQNRKALISYLESQLLSTPSIVIDYLSIKSKEKNLLTLNSTTGEDMAELQEMVREDKPVDEMDGTEALIARIRNPRK